MNKAKEICDKLYDYFKKYSCSHTIKYDPYKIYNLLSHHFVNMEECSEYVFDTVKYTNGIVLYTRNDDDNYYLIASVGKTNLCPQHSIYCLNLCILSTIYENKKSNK